MEENKNNSSKIDEKSAERKVLVEKENGQVKRQNIIPSYMKKSSNIDESKNLNKKEKNNKKKKLFKSKIKYISSFLIVLVISLIIYKIYVSNKYKNYEIYEEDMENYGFSLMYNNNTATTYDSVSKSEMVKVIVSSLLNRYDISDIWPMEYTEYDNEIWVDYAVENGLLTEGYIDKDNQNKKATYIEAINLLSKYKSVALKESLDIEGNPTFKDFEKFNNDEQTVIKDMVWNKIIDNNTDNLKLNKTIVKGELNQLIIRFAEKYNTMTLSSEDKLNINEEKLPYNYKKYTYTLANINKKVYEAKFDNQNVANSLEPKAMYIKCKDQISDWKDIIETYYKSILNVNYNNFDKEEFMQEVNAYSMYNYSLETVEEYQKYIFENKIIIKGGAEIQMPIIYFDGENIRIRVKLQYQILESNTDKNILFGDLFNGKDEIYDEEIYITYIDVKLIQSNLDDFNEIFLSDANVNSLIVDELQQKGD